jgi:hypothetical protein
MARKKVTKPEPKKVPPEFEQAVAKALSGSPLGLCRKCKHFAQHNRLKGYWEGNCAAGNGMVSELHTCEKWTAKNG